MEKRGNDFTTGEALFWSARIHRVRYFVLLFHDVGARSLYPIRFDDMGVRCTLNPFPYLVK